MTRKSVVLSFVVIAAALGVLGYLGYLMLYKDALVVRPPDYCPTGTWAQVKEGFAVPGHTAILIDTSNEIPAEDAELAFQAIENWTREAPFLQRLSIYALPASAGAPAVRSYGSWCIPKDGEKANLIYENPVYVEAQFRRFLATAQDIFQKLVDRDEAAQSPIVETMAGLVRRNDDLDSVILVSDMLQNTDLWSHYTMEGDSLGTSSECQRIAGGAQLLEAVHVYYIHRSLPEIQAPEWPDAWWGRCLGGVRATMLN